MNRAIFISTSSSPPSRHRHLRRSITILVMLVLLAGIIGAIKIAPFAHTAHVPMGQHGLMQPQHPQSFASCGFVSCYSGLEGFNSNSPIDGVSSSWVVNCPSSVNQPGSQPGSMVSTWVGLGNLYGGGPWLRAGIFTQIQTFTINFLGWTYTFTAPVNKAFFEYTGDPNNPGMQMDFTANCGDNITALVAENGPPSEPFQVEITDYTTNANFDRYLPATVDTSAAECIVQDPLLSSPISNLMNFGTVTFNDCAASTSDGRIHGMLDFPANRQWQIASNVDLMDSLGNISSGGRFFTLTWLNSY